MLPVSVQKLRVCGLQKLTIFPIDSWAGMSYLALFLCSKFSISIPYLLPYPYQRTDAGTTDTPSAHDPLIADDSPGQTEITPVSLRQQAAAPPAYLFILPLIPISVATYVAATRYSDFRHHGFDILFGATMGTVISWTSFRMYHMPVRRSAGWSWGPRSLSRAFGITLGVKGYVGDEQAKRRDLEAGNTAHHVRLASSGQS